jgi:hypothetical protein
VLNPSQFLIAGLLLTAFQLGAAEPEWKTIFDGKTLNGWKANENAASWTVRDGAIVGDGERSHLFYMGEQCEDCEFKTEIKISPGGNSGMYFRTKFELGSPAGYEAQINNSHTDPRRTGSLYKHLDPTTHLGAHEIRNQLVPDNAWWTQHVIARGNHIVIRVNDKVVVDYMDSDPLQKGYVALQQHHVGSVVHFRNVMLKKLKVK